MKELAGGAFVLDEDEGVIDLGLGKSTLGGDQTIEGVERLVEHQAGGSIFAGEHSPAAQDVVELGASGEHRLMLAIGRGPSGGDVANDVIDLGGNGFEGGFELEGKLAGFELAAAEASLRGGVANRRFVKNARGIAGAAARELVQERFADIEASIKTVSVRL